MDKMNNDVVAAQLREWSRLLGTCQRSDQAYWRVLAGMNEVADDLSPPPRQVRVEVRVFRGWDEDAQFVFDEVPDDNRSIDTLLAAWKLMVLREFNKVVSGCAKLSTIPRPSIIETELGSLTLELVVSLDFAHALGDIPDADAIQEVFYEAGWVAGDFVICSSTDKENA
jgi:hypothetical protein